MMKKKLTDLIPIFDMFQAEARHDREFDECLWKAKNGLVTFEHLERENNKDLAYQILVAAYNVGIGLTALALSYTMS